jgi:SWI/SNF-related matrix-associated actin-dependent regulator of chromatin subfamily A member 5
MISLYEQSRNGILADDMGLGKTIQAISFMAYLLECRRDRGPHLVVLPKTVMMNFKRECRKWLPALSCVALPGEYELRAEILRTHILPRKFDILICTYESLMSCFKPLSRIQWASLVVDEAHKIKNQNSQRYLHLSHIQADFKLLMTGTPIGVDIV